MTDRSCKSKSVDDDLGKLSVSDGQFSSRVMGLPIY